ncbi:MAG: TspO/MBR family protein [Altererythrobacter ishigakiensis]|nr:TspO/MBR family protein [Altererythrobacter ishigakiensis]
MSKNWVIPFVVAAIAAMGVAFLGATITDLGPWYQSLEKPGWNPPDVVFPIAWTTIFALACVSAVTAWEKATTPAQRDWVISLFALNAFLNILWSLLFFRLQRPDLAFAELLLLWLSILLLVVFCSRISKLSGLLLAPYLIWVSVAGALNWQVIELNGPFG